MDDINLSLEQQYIAQLASFQQFPVSDGESELEFRRLAKFQEIAKYAEDNRRLMQELKRFCIYEIIHSPSGHRFSGIQCYCRFLAAADPGLIPVFKRIDSYINKELTDRLFQSVTTSQSDSIDIFTKDTLSEVGEVLFNRIKVDVPNAQPDYIKIVIKSRQKYPYNLDSRITTLWIQEVNTNYYYSG